MTRLFLECTIRAALIVAGTAFVLYALRVKVAAVKHRVWTGVLLLMLALPLWTAWGPKAQFHLLPASVERAVTETAPLTSSIPTNDTPATLPPGEHRPAAQPMFSTFEEALLGLYLFGVSVLLVRLAIGTAKASRLVRESVESDGIRTNARCAAPVTVGCLRPTVILPEGWREWRKEQLETVLAHEREHVRRRDPLVQWLTLLNRAIFWFHPAAWWLERELSALAEESCDAAVIAQGHDPRDYAEALMNMARAVMKSGSRVNLISMAMPGPCLPERIRTIIEKRSISRISRTRIACLTVACITLCSTFVAGMLTSAQSSDEDWEKAAGGKTSFDVASVKQNPVTGNRDAVHSNIPLDEGDGFSPTGGLFSAADFPLIAYTGFAFKLTIEQQLSVQSQLPKWAATDRYDIEARGAGNPTKDQFRLMMQALLADRFKLAVHFENRKSPILALVVDKPGTLGPQLRQHATDVPCVSATASGGGPAATVAGGFPQECGGIVGLPSTTGGRILRIGARDVPITALTDLVSGKRLMSSDKPIVDRTGLGKVDFVIEFSPEVPSADSEADPNGPTFLEALKNQLGLRMDSTTAPVDFVVVDHVEEPTAN